MQLLYQNFSSFAKDFFLFLKSYLFVQVFVFSNIYNGVNIHCNLHKIVLIYICCCSIPSGSEFVFEMKCLSVDNILHGNHIYDQNASHKKLLNIIFILGKNFQAYIYLCCHLYSEDFGLCLHRSHSGKKNKYIKTFLSGIVSCKYKYKVNILELLFLRPLKINTHHFCIATNR